MKTLIVSPSVHHHSTGKRGEGMGRGAGGGPCPDHESATGMLAAYDHVRFGSGI